MELYPHIIEKEYINSTILPYSSEDSIHNASVNEVLLLDIRGKVGDAVYDDLVINGKLEEEGTDWQGFADNTQKLLDAGLKLAIGYYVVARTMRKPSTPTRFGVTNKLNSEMTSEPASNSQLVTQSNYYKDCADQIINRLLSTFNVDKDNNNPSFRMTIVGE